MTFAVFEYSTFGVPWLVEKAPSRGLMGGVFQLWSICQATTSKVGVNVNDAPVDFAQFLQGKMTEHGLTALALGKRLGHKGNGYVSKALLGKKVPKVSQLDKWAKALRLSHGEVKTMTYLVELGHAPESVCQRQYALEREIARLRTVILQLVEQMREKGIDVPDELLSTIKPLG